MKRLIFCIAILIYVAACNAQVNDVRGTRVIVDQSLFLGPSASYGRWVDTIYNDTTNLNSYVRSVPTNNAMYDFVQGRTTSLTTAINLRLLKSDTASMLSVYVRRQELKDTAAAIRAAFISSGGVSDGDKGDITVSAAGLTWIVDNDAITFAKLQNISASNRFIGRFSGGSGNAEEMTGTVATAMLDVFTSSLKGLAPSSGGGTTNYLRADGTWAAPPGTGGGGGGTYTSSNLGGGLANYASQSGNDFRFNTFNTNDFNLASNLIAIDYANGQKVTHSVDGFATTIQAIRWDSVTYFRNTGPTGAPLLVPIAADLLGIKKLIAGTNVTLDEGDSSVTINATGGGGGGRFGFLGEDDTAGEDRIMDMGEWSFVVKAFNTTLAIESYADAENYSKFRAIDAGSISMEVSSFSLLSSISIGGTVIQLNSADGFYKIVGLPDYADDTAAGVAGLTTGNLYRTGSNVKIVQ